jgi:hypothetical protein
MPAAKELGLTPEWAERDEAVCISL